MPKFDFQIVLVHFPFLKAFFKRQFTKSQRLFLYFKGIVKDFAIQIKAKISQLQFLIKFLLIHGF